MPTGYNATADEDEETASDAVLSLVGASEVAFNPAGTAFSIMSSCFLSQESVFVVVNNDLIEGYNVMQNKIVFMAGLPSGYQSIAVGGVDTNGNEVRTSSAS